MQVGLGLRPILWILQGGARRRRPREERRQTKFTISSVMESLSRNDYIINNLCRRRGNDSKFDFHLEQEAGGGGGDKDSEVGKLE